MEETQERDGMNALLNDLATFRDERGWARYHTPRNLAEALAVEAGELLQCFLWDGALAPRRCGLQFGHGGSHVYAYQGYIGSCPAVTKSDQTAELADVLIYALNLCLALNVDPEQIVRAKMAQNAQKYPVSA